MRFAAFIVDFHASKNFPNGETFLMALKCQWPEFQPDDQNYDVGYEKIYVYQTSAGLIQLLACCNGGLTLRFAYSNPRSVYMPFCAITEWLMRSYGFTCHLHSEPAPIQQGVSREITEPEQVCATLIPSMDYNRRLWQGDAGTEEEAILRPGHAIMRFITPQLLELTP